ncbi:hypothetical protein DPMN_106716 [Dreissena polymorpha]|uniref:Uncharacterized protein n=1 Tax=Dreissena polymorpha TaxID=45954 RepID=A0A9D4K5G8_DREPO|nr:hypothetical protein DPMN_106716 [Dreissena polymorpha]
MNVGPQWSPIVWKQVTDSSPGYHFIKLYEEMEKQLSLSKSQPQAQANKWKRKCLLLTRLLYLKVCQVILWK